MKQLLYLVMALIVIVAITPSVSAVTYAWFPNGIPSGTQTPNVGTVLYSRSYVSNAAAYAAYCTNATTPIGNYYQNVKKTNGWLITDGNGNLIVNNGTVSTIGVNPAIDYNWDTSGTVTHYFEQVECRNAGSTIMNTYNIRYVIRSDRSVIQNSSDILYPVNFTATPTTGPSPSSVTFTITNSTSIMGSVSWSFGDGNVTTSASPGTPLSHLYQNPGLYTVRLDYTNFSSTAKSIQKNNYITVGAPNATATTYAVARDLYTGYAINGAQVDMYDVENTSWTNTTAINGEGSITTLLGHTINIWGSAMGYEDDNLQGVPAVDGGYYSLLLRPTNLTTHNATPGNLTLAVTVQDLQIPHQTLSGAEVTAAWGAQYASGTSNAAGSVFFTVPNNTAVHLSAFKSGYASGSSTHITGSANGGSTMETAIVYIGTDYVTPVPSVTVTTGPGGTVPQTVDPYPCIGDGSPADTANCQRKQGSMAADLISYGPDLVKFFIMLTFIGGIMLLNKR